MGGKERVTCVAQSFANPSVPTLLASQGNETCKDLAVARGSGSPHEGLKSPFLRGLRWEAGWRGLSVASKRLGRQDSLPCTSPEPLRGPNFFPRLSRRCAFRPQFCCGEPGQLSTHSGDCMAREPCFHSLLPVSAVGTDRVPGDQWLCLVPSELTSW